MEVLELLFGFLSYISGLGRFFLPYADFTAVLALEIFVILLLFNTSVLKKSLLENTDKFTAGALLLIMFFAGFSLFNVAHGCSQTGDCEDKMNVARNYLETGEMKTSGGKLYETDHLVISIMSLLFLVFGTGYFLPTIASSIFGALNVLLAFLVGKSLKNSRIGLFSAILYGSSRLLMVWSGDIELYSATITLLLISTLSFLLYFEEKRDIWLFGLGMVSTGMAFMMRFEAVFFLPALMVYFLIERKKIEFYHLSMTPLALLAAPTVIGNIAFQYGMFSKGGGTVNVQGFNLLAEFLSKSPEFLQKLMVELNSPIVSGLFIIGFIFSLKNKKNSRIFMASFAVLGFILTSVALSILLEYGYGTPTYSRVLLPLQIPLLTLAAIGFEDIISWLESLDDRISELYPVFIIFLFIASYATQPAINAKSRPKHSQVVKKSKNIPGNCTVLASRPSVVQIHKDLDVVDISELDNRSRLKSRIERNSCVYISDDFYCAWDQPDNPAYQNCEWIKDSYRLESSGESRNEFSLRKVLKN